MVLAELLIAGNVVWSAPAGCPDEDAFVARLASYLGETQHEFEARGTVTATGNGFRAQLAITAEAGTNTRELEAEDCVSLTDAAALVVAVDVDVLAVSQTPAVSRVLEQPADAAETIPAPPPPEPMIAPAPDPPPEPAAAPPRPRAVSGALRVDTGISVGALPTASLIVGIAGAVIVRRTRVELRASHQLRRRARLDPPNDAAGADVRLWAAAVRVQWLPRVGKVEFPIGAGVELGDMIATGVGVANAQERHGLWGAGLLGAGVAVAPHPRVALWLDPTLVLAFARPGFAVAVPNREALLAHQPTIAGFRATLGVEVRI